MSKLDAQRAMREAKYAADRASGPTRREAAAAESDDEQVLREDLLAAQMRLELGELDAQEFAEIEDDLLGRLREIHVRRRGTASGPLETGAVSGVEVNFGGDHEYARSSEKLR